MQGPRRRPVTSLAADWFNASAAIIDQLEEPELPSLLVDALRRVIDFEYGVVFVYRDKASPVLVFDALPGPTAREALRNFVKSTYVLNPFYTAYLSGLKTGVHRMRDLAPDGFFGADPSSSSKVDPAPGEEIGFLTHGWPAGREEICIALALAHGECAEISLSRKPADGGFSAADLARVAVIVPFLLAAFRRHWRHAALARIAPAPDTKADDAFHAFGGKLLSPRERQLARLLLRGHSTISAGLQLDISPTTVKTHRKNLYAKLGIATHFELFSLFLDSLQA